MSETVLKAGDKMFWSMELIQQTLDLPLARTETLVVVSIEEEDGIKNVRMMRFIDSDITAR